MVCLDNYSAFLQAFGLQDQLGAYNLPADIEYNPFHQPIQAPNFAYNYAIGSRQSHSVPELRYPSWTMHQDPSVSYSSPVPALVHTKGQAIDTSSPFVPTPPSHLQTIDPFPQQNQFVGPARKTMIDMLQAPGQPNRRSTSPAPIARAVSPTPLRASAEPSSGPGLKRKRSQEGLTPLRNPNNAHLAMSEANPVSDDTRNAAHELLGLGMQFDPSLPGGAATTSDHASGRNAAAAEELSSPVPHNAVNSVLSMATPSSRGAMERFLNGATLEELDGRGSDGKAAEHPATSAAEQAPAKPAEQVFQAPAPDFRRFFAAAAAGQQTEAFSQQPNFPPPPHSFAPQPVYTPAPAFSNPYEAIINNMGSTSSMHSAPIYEAAKPIRNFVDSQSTIDMRSSQSSEQGSYTTLATSVSSRAPTPSLNGSVDEMGAPKKKKGGKKADGDFTGKPNKKDRSGKPPYSYAALIGQAIFNVPDKRISLNDIYSFIIGNYTYYKKEDAGWQNSIRHNLSLNECFVKTPRDANQPGKGALWTVADGCDEQFANGGFVKKGGTRKAKAGPKGKANAKAPLTAAAISQLLPPSDTASAGASPAPSENDGAMSDASMLSAGPPKKRARREASLFSQPPSASSSTTTFPEFDKANEEQDDDIDVVMNSAPTRRSHRRRQSSMRDAQAPQAPAELSLPNRNEACEPIKRHILEPPKLGGSSSSAIFTRYSPIESDSLPTHQELTAALLASPVAAVSAGLPTRSTTPPAQSAFGGHPAFLPPAQIRNAAAGISSFRSPVMEQGAEFGGPAYNMFSAITQSPVSSLRGHFDLSGSPRQVSSVRGGDPVDDDEIREDDEGMPAPRLNAKGKQVAQDGEEANCGPSDAQEAQPADMKTPVIPSSVRDEREPTQHTREASRALQFMQRTPGGPGARPYMTSPGKAGSPMALYGAWTNYSDPYNNSLDAELEHFSASKTKGIWPATPKGLSTPHLGSSSSMYSPAW